MIAIDEIIQQLQKEKEYLEEQLKINADQSFFEEAELFRKSLLYKNEKIRILQNLKDFNFDKKQYLKSRIDRNKVNLQEEKNEEAITMTKEELTRLEDELRNLESINSTNHKDSDLLIFLLEKLLRGKLKNVELLIADKSITINIKKRSGIEITIIARDNKDLSGFLSRRAKRELKKMGFRKVGLQAELVIQRIDSQIILTILEKLSRLVYDVFHYYGNRKGFLKYEKID